MNMIEKEIKSTICEITCLNSAEITNNTTIKELGLDSMDFLDFVYRLEEKLNKNIIIAKFSAPDKVTNLKEGTDRFIKLCGEFKNVS